MLPQTPWQKRRFLENLACVVALAGLAALVCLPDIVGKRVPLALENVLFEPPWEEARPPGLSYLNDPCLDLHAQCYYPWYRFMNEAARGGRSLLWNPNEAFGVPFLAVWRTRVLSPFSLPFWLASLPAAFRWSFFLKLLVAGWCAYYAARRFGLPPSLALFVGVSFQLSGPIYLWTGHPMSDVMPWFPLLVVFGERLLLGQFRAWPLGSLVVGVMALGGDPESLAAALGFVVLYLLARRLRERRWLHFSAELTSLGIAVVFGLALAAVQLAPYIEYLRQTTSAPLRPRTIAHLGDAAAILAPNLIDAGRLHAASVLRLLYAGATPLLLLPLWCAVRRLAEQILRRRTESLLLASLVMALTPFVAGDVLDAIPLLRHLDTQHFWGVHAFIFAFVTASAVDEWNLLDPEQCRTALRRLLVFLPVMWCMAVGLIVFALAQRGAPDGAVWRHILAPGLVAGILLALLGITVFRPSARVMGYTLSIVMAASVCWEWWPARPSTQGDLVFPETPFVASLRSMGSRVGGSRGLRRWPLAGSGIPQVFNPSGITLERYRAFMEGLERDPLLLRRSGVEALLLTKEDIQGDFAPIRPKLSIQEVYPTGAILFRDLAAGETGRVRMIYAGRGIEGIDSTRLDAKAPPLLEGATLPEYDDGPVAKAWIETPETYGRVSVHVERSRPGVLVLSDAWYPGWRATVDGKPTAIIPVDTVFRGIEVSEGPHEIVFHYEPMSLKIGQSISVLAALSVLLGLRHTLFRPKSR